MKCITIFQGVINLLPIAEFLIGAEFSGDWFLFVHGLLHFNIDTRGTCIIFYFIITVSGTGKYWI